MDKENKIKRLLKNNSEGLTITEIVKKSRFSRSFIRTLLAKLEGAKEVYFRKVGMAKIYTLSGHENLQAGTLSGHNQR